LNLEELIKGCIRQNSKAQEELYNLYKNVLFVLSLKYCQNEAEAEDNLHNAFIEIFTSIKKYNKKGSFEGWIKRITINKAIDSYKKKYQLVTIKEDLAQDTMLEEDEMDLPLDYILSLIQDLPNQYRMVFCLFELDDYSHQEIAKLLAITEGTSKSNLHRAKVSLKEKIKARSASDTHTLRHGK